MSLNNDVCKPLPRDQLEGVIELAAELKQARTIVAEIEARWEALFTQGISNSILVLPRTLKPRIVQFLEEKPDMSYSMPEIANKLNAKGNSVGPYLSGLVMDGKIERRGRGLYGAVRQSETKLRGEMSRYDAE